MASSFFPSHLVCRMQLVSRFPSVLPGNNFLTSTSSLSHTVLFWGTGKLAGHLAGGQEGQQGRETGFLFDVCYT